MNVLKQIQCAEHHLDLVAAAVQNGEAGKERNYSTVPIWAVLFCME